MLYPSLFMQTFVKCRKNVCCLQRIGQICNYSMFRQVAIDRTCTGNCVTRRYHVENTSGKRINVRIPSYIHRSYHERRYYNSQSTTTSCMYMSTTANTKHPDKSKVFYVDLRGSGLSILERLVIEECILKHDNTLFGSEQQRHWIICGTHTAIPHKHIHIPTDQPPLKLGDDDAIDLDVSIPNDKIAIVMGIGGKPNDLLHIHNVQKDRVPIIKRFTGGGTVILDYNSIWVTIIGRPLPSYNNSTGKISTDSEYEPKQPLHQPRSIMEYTANTIYEPMFTKLSMYHEHKNQANSNGKHVKQQHQTSTLVLDTKSCSLDNSGRVVTIPLHNDNSLESSPSPTSSYKFALQENDYVFNYNGNIDYKMGGNAQAITKNGYLHHTSFLWDYDTSNMEQYLQLPKKRPLYRQDRNHTNFLKPLQDIYPSLHKTDFFNVLFETCNTTFDLERVSIPDVMKIINEQGGIQNWYETKSRTKIIQ
jgi:lipoate-protein ligase A